MTGAEVGLLSALTAMAGGITGVLLGRGSRVTRKECELRSEGIAKRESEHFADIREKISDMKEHLGNKIDAVDAKVDKVDEKVEKWAACILGDSARGRRVYDMYYKDKSDE